MKMDDRDSVECQNWEKGDIIGILGFVLNKEKDKIWNSVVFPKLKVTKKRAEGEGWTEEQIFYFIFRERATSL